MSETTQRIKPLNPRLAFSHDYDTSDYPDQIRIPMEDGHVVTYVRKMEQPHPKLLKTVELIRAMNDCTYGGYKAKHKKNDR